MDYGGGAATVDSCTYSYVISQNKTHIPLGILLCVCVSVFSKKTLNTFEARRIFLKFRDNYLKFVIFFENGEHF